MRRHNRVMITLLNTPFNSFPSQAQHGTSLYYAWGQIQAICMGHSDPMSTHGLAAEKLLGTSITYHMYSNMKGPKLR